MRRTKLIGWNVLLAGCLAALPMRESEAFRSLTKEVRSATAQVTGGTNVQLILRTPSGVTASEVFGGKHFVVPVEVVNPAGPINVDNLRADVVYQMLDATGHEISAPASVPITFLVDPGNPAHILGTGFIPLDELAPIRRSGRLKYFFSVLQNGQGVYLGGSNASKPYPAGSPADALALALADSYNAETVSVLEFPVGPAGAPAYAQDTYVTDGKTGMQFDPGALTANGTLRIERLELNQIPSGPAGARPTVAYRIALENTDLQRPAQMILSYPADLNGSIADNGGSPSALAPYWWDGISWRLLTRAKIDTTLHTVTGYVAPTVGAQGLNGQFALFPAGGSTAVALRPGERIITPNGDGINDEAGFSGLTDGDEVKIFDVRGRRVRTVGAGDHCRVLQASRCWDGRDDDGSVVESGIYLYQFTSAGERVSGVIAVAK